MGKIDGAGTEEWAEIETGSGLEDELGDEVKLGVHPMGTLPVL